MMIEEERKAKRSYLEVASNRAGKRIGSTSPECANLAAMGLKSVSSTDIYDLQILARPLA